MEGGGGGMSFESGNHVARKRRSFASRRPRTDKNFFSDCREFVSVSSADAENSTIYAQPGNTEFDGRTPDDAYNGGSLGYGSEFRRSSEGVLAPANWNSGGKKIRVISEVKDPEDHLNGVDGSHVGHTGSTVNGSGIPCEMGSNGSPQEGKLKVKLKVGGVTHTIHTKPAENLSGSRRTSPTNLSKPPRSSGSTRRRYKLVLSDNSDDAADQSSPDDGLQGLQLKGNKALSSSKIESRGKISVKSSDRSSNASAESVRKSRRAPKRRALDQDFDDDDDDEIRYLERLKTSKANADSLGDYGDEYQEDGSHKQRSSRTSKKRISINDFGNEPDFDTGSCKGNTKRVRSRDSDGLSNADDEDNNLDNEDDEDADDFGSGSRRKTQKKEFIDKIVDERKDIPLTTRQRTLKDPSSRISSSLIEFPNGLPPAAPKKQKEKLTDVEQQLKKAEAAQRRRMQVEKNTRELEALAIRKILGQDANGKKKGEKSQKRREGLAQERAARELELAANSIRLIMGPTGTVVSFPKNSGLPGFFGSKISSYPPPREKCAGPACTNTFKYRDSVSKLPLCSLQCYRAIHKTMEPLTSC